MPTNDNTVQIMLRVVENEQSGMRGESLDADQKTRDSSQLLEKMKEEHSKFERLEHRLEHRMMHMASKMTAGFAIGELLGEGAEHSGVGRLGESAIEGFMMGGAMGAAFRTSLTLIHELINQVKGQSESIQKIKEQQAAAEKRQQDEDKERQASAKHQEELLQKTLTEEREARDRKFFAEEINVQRYSLLPYLGAGGRF